MPSSFAVILGPKHTALTALFPEARVTGEKTRFGRASPQVTQSIIDWLMGETGFYALLKLDPAGLNAAAKAALNIDEPAELAISQYCFERYLEALDGRDDRDEGVLFAVYGRVGPAARGRVALEYWLSHK